MIGDHTHTQLQQWISLHVIDAIRVSILSLSRCSGRSAIDRAAEVAAADITRHKDTVRTNIRTQHGKSRLITVPVTHTAIASFFLLVLFLSCSFHIMALHTHTDTRRYTSLAGWLDGHPSPSALAPY